MHMKNVQIKCGMRLVHQFEGKVTLDFELKRNMEIGQKYEK
jgi:hypothetical protein